MSAAGQLASIIELYERLVVSEDGSVARSE
jgi:hypothetical protein